MKVVTLRKQRDFQALRKQGRRVALPACALQIRQKEGQEMGRWGFIITRKYGNAVRRNRLRRQLKEIAKTISYHDHQGFDCVVIPRKMPEPMDFWAWKSTLETLFKKVGHGS